MSKTRENIPVNVDNYVDKNFNSQKSGEQYSYFEIIKILIKRSIKYIILSALYPYRSSSERRKK